ncbi:acyl-CoA thioesterase [Saccharospirillum impatiens]|uniref:acyl-CoA thioesterase n=1 Tax=Saccharospirillum impatiens TaxID=169438 RepID=UPI00042760E9|nr:acyl-CoA thioesterase [Saccharospirillum impatiens]
MSYQYRLDFKVRDYECDLQGIVNNAVYQNYLEHCRHEFLLDRGVDFAALSRDGINLVVVRAELDYKRSLTSQDEFYIGLNMSMMDRVRFVFEQSVIRQSDSTLCLQARIVATALNERGRPKIPKGFIEQLTP